MVCDSIYKTVHFMSQSEAEKIAEGLLKGIGGQFGLKIFQKLFGSGGHEDIQKILQSFYAQMYKDVTSIVKKELDANTIHQVNGAVGGLIEWVNDTFLPRVNSHTASKRELFDMLVPQESNLQINAIGVLQQSEFAQPGLSVFMVAAGMHFVLLQELAYMDPDVHSPLVSSYAESIKKYAASYASYVDSTFKEIIDKRLGYIVVNESETVRESGDEITYHFKCSWHDRYNNRNGNEEDTITIKKTEKAPDLGCSEYDSAKQDLIKACSDPQGTADKWRKLIKQPIPQPKS